MIRRYQADVSVSVIVHQSQRGHQKCPRPASHRLRSHFSLVAGVLPPFNPAEDPVPTMHQEPAVRHPEGQQEPLPVLPPQEVYRRWHEQGW